MSDRDAVSGAISKMVDAVNNGDFGEVIATFSAEATIIEDIAPFRWQGPDAPSSWLTAMGENAARLDARAIVMKLGGPVRVDVVGTAAYAVFPGTLSLVTASGKLLSNGTLTFTLEKSDERWLIDALVWGGPEPALG